MTGSGARRAWVVMVAAVVAGCGDEGPAGEAETAVADTFSADTADAGDAQADVADDALAADTLTVDTSAPACPAPTGARPAARAEHAGIYDPSGGHVVLFGGSFGVPQNCSPIVAHTFENEVWLYDIACDQWRKAEATAPVGRVRHAAVYDAKRHRMLVYGGRERKGTSGAYTLHPEVAAFDLASETWSELATNSGPAARYNLGAAYDPTGDRMIVMGGNTSTSALTYLDSNDVWALDLATDTWAEVVPAAGTKPGKRFWHAALWDDTRQWLVIFGGSNAQEVFASDAEYYRDLWALDFSQSPPAWTRLDQGALAPEGRFWAGLAHDEANDRYLVFGGHDDQRIGNRNDLWALNPGTGNWKLLGAGDTYNKDPNGVCDFPPDFTTVDMDVPERRHAGVVVSDGGHAWVTGGKTDCGNVDDLFELDLASGGWTERVTATVGEVCIRKGGLNCNDLCF